MDAFLFLLTPFILLTIVMQAMQFHDFRKWRALLIDLVYIGIIAALIFYAKISHG